MFLGHYAAALAAKKISPKTSLGTLLAAALWLDLIWPIFVLLDAEHFHVVQGTWRIVRIDFDDFPLSHSLVMVLVWAALWGLAYLILNSKDVKGAWVVSGLVLSNWVLDLFVYRHDLPLLPENPDVKWGFGLWDHPVPELILETGLFLLGLWLYRKATKAIQPLGDWLFWVFGLAVVADYLFVLLGPVPVDDSKITLLAFSQLVFVAWAYWIDDYRKTV